jgi:hypothetical protein
MGLYLIWVAIGSAVALPSLLVIWGILFGLALRGPLLLLELTRAMALSLN